jgi:hypothetical protein
MKLATFLLLGLSSAVLWLLLLVATGFNPAAIGTGLLGVFLLEGRTSWSGSSRSSR